MLGDNDNVVNSSMSPQGNVHKRHVPLSFHRFRETIAANVISYKFINGKINPVDVLSNNWAHHYTWSNLKPLFFERSHYGVSR